MIQQQRGFIERHAGKFLIAMFLVPFPARVFDLFLVDIVLSGIFLILAIIGYVQRSRLKKARTATEVDTIDNADSE